MGARETVSAEQIIAKAAASIRLAFDHGQRVTMDDLDNIPPPDGYEFSEPPTVNGKAVNRAVVPSAKEVRILALPELQQAASGARWLCKGIVPADAITMFFGASGAFKSFVALDFALHVAHGLRWLGKRTARAGVLYLAAEGGAGLWRRIEAWHKARGRDWHDAEFRAVTVPLDLLRDADALRSSIDALDWRPGLIVIDTFSQTFTGEENSANEVADWLAAVGRELRGAFSAAVLVIHHSGHSNTERPRGSSAITANVDALYGVFRDEKEMLCTLECGKAKDSERPQSAQFTLAVHELGKDDDGDPVTSLVASHIATAADVVKAVQHEAHKGRGKNRAMLLRLAEHGQMEALVRAEFIKGLDEDMSLENKRQQWHKVKHWAIDAGIFEIVEGKIYRRD